jgi:hypothetical protein
VEKSIARSRVRSGEGAAKEISGVTGGIDITAGANTGTDRSGDHSTGGGSGGLPRTAKTSGSGEIRETGSKVTGPGNRSETTPDPIQHRSATPTA